jgi:hypothetical protein
VCLPNQVGNGASDVERVAGLVLRPGLVIARWRGCFLGNAGVEAAAVRQNGREHADGDGVIVTSPAGMRSLSAMVMAVRRLRHHISYRLVQTVLSANLPERFRQVCLVRCGDGGGEGGQTAVGAGAAAGCL